jgi:hypothetical protein
MNATRSALLFTALLVAALAPRAPAADPAPRPPEAYLFAHMTREDYGRLYYSVSTDGRDWTPLNGGRRVMGDEYRGHPEIARGPDGTWWLVGVRPRENPGVILWRSPDLITWTRGPEIDGARFDVGERKGGAPSLGAPKLFYDSATALFYLTWHAARRDLPPHLVHGVNEARWSDMRTFVMTSPDLQTWTTARTLFQSDLATIDVIIRREGDRYYAILKDERYPTFEHPTGKSIRIAHAAHPLGPWSEPGPAISPNYHEAPTLIPRADGPGWLLYHEQYPGIQYKISTARTLEGPWYQEWINTYQVPPVARHGVMLPISRAEYDALVAAFPPAPAEEPAPAATNTMP